MHRNGMAIRFDEADARAMGRNTRGVKGITLQGDDEVVGMVVADPDGLPADGVRERLRQADAVRRQHRRRGAGGGRGGGGSRPRSRPRSRRPRRAEGEEAAEDRSAMRYRKQRRGGKGVRDIRTSERNGPVVGVAAVRDGDDIMLITTQGMVNRTHVSEIRVVGRNTQGVRVMNLNEGDKIASLAKVAQEEGEAEDATDAPEGEAPTTPPAV